MGMPCSTDLRGLLRHVTLSGQEVIVSRRRIAFALLGILLCAVSLSLLAADREITTTIVEADGHREITVSTALADYLFSEQGGVMKSLFITFATYGSEVAELVPGTITTEEQGSRFYQYVETSEFPFTIVGGTEEEGIYTLQEPRRVDSNTIEVAFVGSIGGATVTKQYTIREDAVYTVDLQVTIENPTAEPLDLTMVLLQRIEKEGSKPLYFLFNGTVATDRLAPASDTTFDGVGLMDKATIFFLSPVQGTSVWPTEDVLPSGARRYGVKLDAPTGTSSYDFSLYGGRRRFLLMEPAGLGDLDSPGMGARLMIPVIQFLNMLYRATGNYGWAIILFTILTRLILFPLMRKQYHSMAKMQKLQPKMKRVQERFKDDRQLQQQKMMELYRKEGVNPMSGCLPLLVQLPILVLIWRAILYSGELIHLSPGFLWIPDLSMADPYFILVIVTTGIMMLQQWLMTPTRTETTGMQKYMGYIFPLFMAVLLWRFPAGLWLYYLLTTATQVAQQAIVNREMATAEAKAGPTVETDEIESEGEEDDGGDAGAEEGG